MNAQQLENFEEFWRNYPRRIGKGAARKAYEKAIKVAPFHEIMRGLLSQLAYYASKDAQFIPHPSTWLNQERWSDEVQPPTPPRNNNRTIVDAAREYLDRRSTGHGDLNSPFGFPRISHH